MARNSARISLTSCRVRQWRPASAIISNAHPSLTTNHTSRSAIRAVAAQNSFTCAIGHREDNHIVIDAVREMRPPFSPDAVIDEFAALVRSYGIARVCGDKYAGEFPRELFRKKGIFYVPAAAPKSDLYRDLLSHLNSGHIVLRRNDRLVHQLCGPERRTARSGKDSIDHAPGQHDDLANSAAGCADLVALAERRAPPVAVQTTWCRKRADHSSPCANASRKKCVKQFQFAASTSTYRIINGGSSDDR